MLPSASVEQTEEEVWLWEQSMDVGFTNTSLLETDLKYWRYVSFEIWTDSFIILHLKSLKTLFNFI